MENNTVIPLEVSSTDRDDKLISKQTELISLKPCAAENTKKNVSSNTNQLSHKNEHSIDKADVIHVYENSTHITDEISESGFSKLTQSESIKPQTVEEGASYIQMDNYISVLSNDKLNESETSTKTEAISIKPSNAGITKQAKTKATKLNGSIAGITDKNTNQFTEDAPTIQERVINKNDLVNLPSIYEDIMDEAEPDGVSAYDNSTQISTSKDIMNKAEPDGVSIHDNNPQISIYEEILNMNEPSGVSTYNNNRQISSTDQLHKTSLCKSTNRNKKMITVQPRIMTNKCKLALVILLGLVITVPVISLIIWGVNSRDKVNKNATRSSQNDTSPGNRKRTASIGLTAWATSVVIYAAGTTLIFNGTDEEHNGFDRSTGLFTCPITGIYYVYVTLRKNNLHNIYVDVFKMDTRIIRFSHNCTGSPWNIVSNSALVSCSMGELIQMKGWNSGSIFGEAFVRCSSFSVINVDQIAQNSADQTFVGYSGYANSQLLSKGDPMNFSNPLCNVGNQFSSSRYTCPYTGIYFVSVTYCKYPPNLKVYQFNVHVYRGDTKILSSYEYYKPYTCVTNNALVRCNKGEYIETQSRGTSYVYGSGSYPESIFTVMSMHQEDRSQPFIGFSRYKIGDKLCSAGDVITFTGIIMDDMNYFQSNQFVIPVDGSYYFLLNLMKSASYNIDVGLKHGDETVFKLADTHSKQYKTFSNSAVIRGLKGEVVKVVAARRSGVFGHPKNKLTTFTGFLLYN